MRDLLEQATDLRDECDHLQRDIEEAVRAGDTETLPALVKRLYKLKPNNKAIKQLAADVKQHGAKKVIALRKGQRRFLDPAGRIVEPWQIAASVALVAGLFLGVTLLVWNNNDKSKDSGKRKSSEDITKNGSGNTSPDTGTTNTPDVEPPPPPQDATSTFTGMKFTLIPAGTFTMGSPDTEVDRMPEEGPQHTVRISQPFYMGVYEVTQGEYEKVMGTNPSHFKSVAGQDTSRLPVEKVSWFDAVEFCNRLSEKDGQSVYYTITNVPRDGDSIKSASVAVAGGTGYRLPTEAECEYACRAGTTTPFHFGSTLNGDRDNVNGNLPYGTRTKKLSQKPCWKKNASALDLS